MPHSDLIVNGEKWPSVTEITGQLSGGPWLNEWYAKHGTLKANILRDMWGKVVDFDQVPDSTLQKAGLSREDFWKDANDLKEEAQKKGILRHQEFEEYLKLLVIGEKPIANPGLFTYPLGKWLELRNLSVLSIEKKVQHMGYQFHGSCDAILQDKNGKQILVDWKFTGKIYLSGILQLAGYDIGLGEPYRKGYLLRFYEVSRLPKQDNLKLNGFKTIYKFKDCAIQIEEIEVPVLRGFHPYFHGLRELFQLKQNFKL